MPLFFHSGSCIEQQPIVSTSDNLSNCLQRHSSTIRNRINLNYNSSVGFASAQAINEAAKDLKPPNPNLRETTAIHKLYRN